MAVYAEEGSSCTLTCVRSMPFFPEAQLTSSQKVEVSRSGFLGEFQDPSEPVDGFGAVSMNCAGERHWEEKVIFLTSWLCQKIFLASSDSGV